MQADSTIFGYSEQSKETELIISPLPQRTFIPYLEVPLWKSSPSGNEGGREFKKATFMEVRGC